MQWLFTVGDLHSKSLDSGKIFFIFTQFSANFDTNNMLVAPFGLTPPHLENPRSDAH